MRPAVVLLIGFLVANAVPGPGVQRAPMPEPATNAFCVSQGAIQYSVGAVERATGVVGFYDYYSVSSHDPFVQAYNSVLYLYTDTNSTNTTGRLYLVFHFNIDDGGSPDAQTTVSIVGIPAGAGVALSDDQGEFQLSRFPQGQFRYFLNTDGGILGPLPTSSNWQMNVTVSHFGVDPMRSQDWIDGDGTRLPLNLTGVIRVTNVCNQAPAANAGGPYSGFEGSPITFNAGGSSDPDGDALTYTWDFQNDGVNDVTTTSPTVPHTYPDDFLGKAKLTVSDGTASASTAVDVTVANVAPSVLLDALAPATEGAGVLVQLRVTDPGMDTVIVDLDQGDTRGPTVIGQLFHPTDSPITQGVTWGDDGWYPVLVTATDDDGGVGTAGGIAQIDNEVPGVTAVTNPSGATGGEGEEATVEVRGRDPGSDDLRLDVDFGNGDLQSTTFFNDGVGPDPNPSPLGTYPFEASATFRTRYVDDGLYTIRVTAADDDGGSGTLEFPFRVLNVAPTIVPFGPGASAEGSPGSLAATASDPGMDALTFTWEFELGPTATEAFPATGSPMTATSVAGFLYGDDGTYSVKLTVTDDDGASTTYETTVEVANVAPTAAITQVSRTGSFVLRVAGEKWHDVTATFSRDGQELESIGVVRMPGSPNEQAVGTTVYDLALASRFTAKIRYTPEDDPVNGQPNGANPVWILVLADNGTEVARVHHTFNVQHPGTYEWDVDVTPYVAALAVRFAASATDAGSDDLAFAWDFGDGTSIATSVAYNDGVGPDPAKSPGGTFPFASAGAVAHAFLAPGTYTVTVTVTDDDGGVATASVTITILG